MTAAQLSVTFFLQMAAIVAACRAVGWVAQRFLGQPQVVGEMIAGVLLGPSVLGALFPDFTAALFPADSRKVLFVGAQFGVGLYMFIVGLTFDRREFASSARSAAVVAVGGMVVPFVAAAALAPALLEIPGLFMPVVGPAQAIQFLGAAIAITAFPMLARIIHERGIAGTRLGVISLSAGAIGDVGAWIVIAFVLASLGDGALVAIKALGGGGLFALFMIVAAPRLLRRLDAIARPGENDDLILAVVLVLFTLCAWAMDAAGIHAVFGGFLLGVAMPRGAVADMAQARLEPFTVVFLLPMFFTYSGLNTDLRLMHSTQLIGVAMLIVAVSVLAKGGACYLTARLCGEDHRTALGIGALMNARGLMELIVINIGLQRGVIGPALFSMLVLMAVVTTLLASPLYQLSARHRVDQPLPG
ncbi:cation:proton antiporter [Novosphingobium sp.]|uniref:cation:proton antiporter n=1 Tax=Novosphingobium sp. TaxID=1874826 RepID=UPI00263110C1|nr:cation:proton antiporter [Novosphingobium sp.]